jgi:hypothetical protein
MLLMVAMPLEDGGLTSDENVEISLVIVADGAGFGFEQFVLVEIHHFLLSGDEVELEGGAQLHEFPQQNGEQHLVGEGVDALDGVGEFQRHIFGGVSDFLDHVPELLLVVGCLLGLVLREDADQKFLVGTVLGDDSLVEGF